MQAPCGRLVTKVVLKDLNQKEKYKELLIYKEPFLTSIKNNFKPTFNSKEEANAKIEEFISTLKTSPNDTALTRINISPQPQATIVVMDQYTGHVKAMVGGRGEKTGNLTLNRVTDAIRQPGSTFKVVAAYAPALEAGGMTLATTQYDGPYLYEEGTDIRAVKNWTGYAYEGWTDLRRGIEQSMNIVSVKPLTQISPQLGYDYLKNFGFAGETEVIAPGINSKMDEVRAAYGILNLSQVDACIEARHQVAICYRKAFYPYLYIFTM